MPLSPSRFATVDRINLLLVDVDSDDIVPVSCQARCRYGTDITKSKNANLLESSLVAIITATRRPLVLSGICSAEENRYKSDTKVPG